jgi:tRNA(adenine34) deaminase
VTNSSHGKPAEFAAAAFLWLSELSRWRPLSVSLPEYEVDAIDRAMMTRCIKLAQRAVEEDEHPFASVISRYGAIVAASTNQLRRQSDQSRHAEIIAIAQARQVLGTNRLDDCTLYSIVEPCPMCAFCIRTARIGRVVYALDSPVMGGISHWNILGDETLSKRIPFLFRPPPQVTAGALAAEAECVWRDWNPLVWQLIKMRRFITVPQAKRSPIHRPSVVSRLILGLSRWLPDRLGPVD